MVQDRYYWCCRSSWKHPYAQTPKMFSIANCLNYRFHILCVNMCAAIPFVCKNNLNYIYAIMLVIQGPLISRLFLVTTFTILISLCKISFLDLELFFFQQLQNTLEGIIIHLYYSSTVWVMLLIEKLFWYFLTQYFIFLYLEHKHGSLNE